MSVTVLMRELRRLFDAGCKAAEIAEDRRHYQGMTFTPPDPMRVYARETVISGAEYGTGPRLQESVGIYQIDVSGPMGDGTRDVTDAVDVIRAEFAPGHVRTIDGVGLAIDSASVLALQQDSRTITIPISVTYRTWRTPAARTA